VQHGRQTGIACLVRIGAGLEKVTKFFPHCFPDAGIHCVLEQRFSVGHGFLGIRGKYFRKEKFHHGAVIQLKRSPQDLAVSRVALFGDYSHGKDKPHHFYTAASHGVLEKNGRGVEQFCITLFHSCQEEPCCFHISHFKHGSQGTFFISIDFFNVIYGSPMLIEQAYH